MENTRHDNHWLERCLGVTDYSGPVVRWTLPLAAEQYRSPGHKYRCTDTIVTELSWFRAKPLKRWRYRGADKFLVRPERKQATATEDFDVHISYL